MTESTVRCKMKWGGAEFEVEGVADKELKEKINNLFEIFKQAVAKETVQRGDKRTSQEKPSSKGSRGGRKAPFYKGNIQRIIDEEPEWFVKRSVGDVTKKLTTEYSVPGANEVQVSNALGRFFKKGLLTRKEEDGKYLYSITSLRK